MLLEDQQTKLSTDSFATLCVEQLPAALASAAVEMLGAATGAMAKGAQPRHRFVAAWLDADAQLRNAIALERSRRSGAANRPEARETAGCSPWLAQAVAAAFAAKDPLSRETAIDSIRWRILDEMQGVSPFSEAVILAYAGKLALNARRFSASADAGMERFKALTARGAAAAADAGTSGKTPYSANR